MHNFNIAFSSRPELLRRDHTLEYLSPHLALIQRCCIILPGKVCTLNVDAVIVRRRLLAEMLSPHWQLCSDLFGWRHFMHSKWLKEPLGPFRIECLWRKTKDLAFMYIWGCNWFVYISNAPQNLHFRWNRNTSLMRSENLNTCVCACACFRSNRGSWFSKNPVLHLLSCPCWIAACQAGHVTEPPQIDSAAFLRMMGSGKRFLDQVVNLFLIAEHWLAKGTKTVLTATQMPLQI